MDEIQHDIEKYIIRILAYADNLRFSEMKPLRVDSNLYTYHLGKLVRLGYVAKTERRYSLAPKGLEYVDRLSMRTMRPVLQSKITTCLLVKNEQHEVLLVKRQKHPFLGRWGLPLSKTHLEDVSLQWVVQRDLYEITELRGQPLRHVGDCYKRVVVDEHTISNILAHVFFLRVDKSAVRLGSEYVTWGRLGDFAPDQLVPGTREIAQLAHTSKEHFFEEIIVEG
jgi:ADP-ribose pyrophosphatase YjhB (NUDIX family)